MPAAALDCLRTRASPRLCPSPALVLLTGLCPGPTPRPRGTGGMHRGTQRTGSAATGRAGRRSVHASGGDSSWSRLRVESRRRGSPCVRAKCVREQAITCAGALVGHRRTGQSPCLSYQLRAIGRQRDQVPRAHLIDHTLIAHGWGAWVLKRQATQPARLGQRRLLPRGIA